MAVLTLRSAVKLQSLCGQASSLSCKVRVPPSPLPVPREGPLLQLRAEGTELGRQCPESLGDCALSLSMGLGM